MTDAWVYHAQDAVTGAWISRSLDLRDVEITDMLSGHCTMRATFAPELEELAEAMEEWQTFIYAEKPADTGNPLRFGGITGGGNVTDDGSALQLDIQSFTAYPVGQPYTDEAPIRMWGADATDALRALWDWVQGQSDNADLGLIVDSDDGARIISDLQPPPKPDRDDVTYPAGSPYGDPGDPWPRPAKPKKLRRRKPRKRKRRKGESSGHYSAYVDRYEADLDRWQADFNALNKNRLPEWRAWHKRLKHLREQWVEDYGAREPYKVTFWETTDLGGEMVKLAQEGGFEWRERHTWADVGKTAVNHRLQLGIPTIGTVHPDPLVLNDELAALPEQARAGDSYANRVMALGKGQGRKQRRVAVGGTDGRLRRTAVVVRKKVQRLERLTSIARDARSERVQSTRVGQVTVWADDDTLGTYRLGDTITVPVAYGWWSPTEVTCRIVGRRYRPDDDDQITLLLVPVERTSE